MNRLLGVAAMGESGTLGATEAAVVNRFMLMRSEARLLLHGVADYPITPELRESFLVTLEEIEQAAVLLVTFDVVLREASTSARKRIGRSWFDRPSSNCRGRTVGAVRRTGARARSARARSGRSKATASSKGGDPPGGGSDPEPHRPHLRAVLLVVVAVVGIVVVPAMSQAATHRDARDPYGRAKIGVKVNDEMRRSAPPAKVPSLEMGGYWHKGKWADPTVFGELANEWQDTNAALLMSESDLVRWHRAIEAGERDRAQIDVERNFGAGSDLETVIAEKSAWVEQLREELRHLDIEIAHVIWTDMWPDAPSPWDYDQREHTELHEGRQPLDFDHESAVLGQVWGEISDSFVDKGFAQNPEILISLFKSGGVVDACMLIKGLRVNNFKTIETYCARITQQERKSAGDDYNRLRPRRRIDGKVVIVVDQPGNPDYRPPFVPSGKSQTFIAVMRLGGRTRQSQGKCHRRRGSRRVSSRSTGGGSSGDDLEENPSQRLTAAGVSA